MSDMRKGWEHSIPGFFGLELPLVSLTLSVTLCPVFEGLRVICCRQFNGKYPFTGVVE